MEEEGQGVCRNNETKRARPCVGLILVCILASVREMARSHKMEDKEQEVWLVTCFLKNVY